MKMKMKMKMKKISMFIFRTRGLYMLIALGIAIAIKQYFNQTTPFVYFLIGAAVVVTAQTFRFWAAAYLWGRHAVLEAGADFLCTSGPYAYIRNPLYLGNLFIGVGFCIMINEWYAYLLFLISYALVYQVVIPYEEEFLEEKFKENYVKYKNQTHRLMPSFKPYRENAETMPDWKAGIMGEIHAPFMLAVISLIIYVLFVG